MQEITIFPQLSLSAPQILTTQNVWFPFSLKVPASLCLPMDPCCLQDVCFPATWPLSPPPISLLIPSYLPAVTIGNKYNFPGVTSPPHPMRFQCRPDGEQCQRHLPPPRYKHRPKWGTWTSTPAFTCWYSVRGGLLKEKNWIIPRLSNQPKCPGRIKPKITHHAKNQ